MDDIEEMDDIEGKIMMMFKNKDGEKTIFSNVFNDILDTLGLVMMNQISIIDDDNEYFRQNKKVLDYEKIVSHIQAAQKIILKVKKEEPLKELENKLRTILETNSRYGAESFSQVLTLILSGLHTELEKRIDCSDKYSQYHKHSIANYEKILSHIITAKKVIKKESKK